MQLCLSQWVRHWSQMHSSCKFSSHQDISTSLFQEHSYWFMQSQDFREKALAAQSSVQSVESKIKVAFSSTLLKTDATGAFTFDQEFALDSLVSLRSLIISSLFSVRFFRWLFCHVFLTRWNSVKPKQSRVISFIPASPHHPQRFTLRRWWKCWHLNRL